MAFFDMNDLCRFAAYLSGPDVLPLLVLVPLLSTIAVVALSSESGRR